MSWLIKNGPICYYFHFLHTSKSALFSFGKRFNILCYVFNGRCRKCVLGHGLHLLPLLLAIYFSPLYIFRAIGRTVFIVNQLGHAPCPSMYEVRYVHVYLHVYSRGAAFPTMFDHLSIWHATQSSILFTSQIYLCTEKYASVKRSCSCCNTVHIKIPPNIFTYFWGQTDNKMHIFYYQKTVVFFRRNIQLDLPFFLHVIEKALPDGIE